MLLLSCRFWLGGSIRTISWATTAGVLARRAWKGHFLCCSSDREGSWQFIWFVSTGICWCISYKLLEQLAGEGVKAAFAVWK